MDKMIIKNISNLEKVFYAPECAAGEKNGASALKGEEFAYQVAFKLNVDEMNNIPLNIKVVSDIAEYITLYNIRFVPVLLNHCHGHGDDDYLSHEPGLFPDILEEYDGSTMASYYNYRSVFVDVKLSDSVSAGVHSIKLIFERDNEFYGESNFALEVIDALLPKSDIIYTNWFHCDCIATYHNVTPLSNKHWELIDRYLAVAAEHGMNMLLTPIFTPALDTKVGHERPTIQLLDISFENGKYSFGFEKLEKWLALCKKHGIEYLELAHLFSQWGAKHTPKIVVRQNGRLIKKFGWKTDALGDDYKDFLTQLLPALTKFLSENWDKNKVYFHITDEPSEEHIEHYGKLAEFVKPFIAGFKHLDAISHFELYSKGYIGTPAALTAHIKPFLEAKIDNLWTYYCCAPANEHYSNRLLAMPSYRNRILGMQLYKYDIKGFLHWGYNFYYSQLSVHPINPFLSTDADAGFPAGDAFVVYPTKDGATPSLRLKVFYFGFQDMMAAKLLEKYIGKDAVLKMIESDMEIDFNHYPQNSEYIPALREKINAKIKEVIK